MNAHINECCVEVVFVRIGQTKGDQSLGKCLWKIVSV